MSHSAFMGFATVMVLGLSLGWFVVDANRLRHVLRADRSDPDVRDRIFGSIIGLMVASLGIFGVVHYHVTN